MSKYLERVKAGEALFVTERGRQVARLTPSGPATEPYVDTSAVGRVLRGEPDAAAVLPDLAEFEQHVASRLLRIELRRLAVREDAVAAPNQLLSGVSRVPWMTQSSRRPRRCRRRPSRHSTPSASRPRWSWPTRVSSTRS